MSGPRSPANANKTRPASLEGGGHLPPRAPPSLLRAGDPARPVSWTPCSTGSTSLSVLVVASSQCSAGTTFPSDLVAAPHGRCSTILGPPGLLTAVAASPLARVQWLSSCGALLARLFRRFLSLLPPRSALLVQLFRWILSLPLTADAPRFLGHPRPSHSSRCITSHAHAVASSCGALLARLFCRFLLLPPRSAAPRSRCSAGPTFSSDLVATPHGRCSTILGPRPSHSSRCRIVQPLTRMQGLLPAEELCWLDFSVGSCRCLLAVLCWPNFSVRSCLSLPLTADALASCDGLPLLTRHSTPSCRPCQSIASTMLSYPIIMDAMLYGMKRVQDAML